MMKIKPWRTFLLLINMRPVRFGGQVTGPDNISTHGFNSRGDEINPSDI